MARVYTLFPSPKKNPPAHRRRKGPTGWGPAEEMGQTLFDPTTAALLQGTGIVFLIGPASPPRIENLRGICHGGQARADARSGGGACWLVRLPQPCVSGPSQETGLISPHPHLTSPPQNPITPGRVATHANERPRERAQGSRLSYKVQIETSMPLRRRSDHASTVPEASTALRRPAHTDPSWPLPCHDVPLPLPSPPLPQRRVLLFPPGLSWPGPARVDS